MAAVKKTLSNHDALKAVGDQIIAAILKHDIVVQPDGTPTATVKYATGAYKKKSLGSNWDFYITDCYIGKSDNLIFIASSPDQSVFDSEGRAITPWEHAEFSVKDLDSFFPMLLSGLEPSVEVRSSMTATIESLYSKIIVASQMEEADSIDRVSALPTFGLF